MNAKEFVKQHYPKARAERHVSGMIRGPQKTYWLIRTQWDESMWFADGKTQSNAWVNAKKRILANTQPNPGLQATAGTRPVEACHPSGYTDRVGLGKLIAPASAS